MKSLLTLARGLSDKLHTPRHSNEDKEEGKKTGEQDGHKPFTWITKEAPVELGRDQQGHSLAKQEATDLPAKQDLSASSSQASLNSRGSSFIGTAVSNGGQRSQSTGTQQSSMDSSRQAYSIIPQSSRGDNSSMEDRNSKDDKRLSLDYNSWAKSSGEQGRPSAQRSSLFKLPAKQGSVEEQRQSGESRQSQPSCGHSRRSSFALERVSQESNRASLDQFPPLASAPISLQPGNTILTSVALCTQLGIPQALQYRFIALAIVPKDTPLPMAMLTRLWRLREASDAEATANLLANLGAMRVACLQDGSAWALVQPSHLQSLQSLELPQLPIMHGKLMDAYERSSPGGLANLADDGYIMQNAGHHLVFAGRQWDLRRLLMTPKWLEAKLLSYGVASVIADFRRYLMAQGDEEIKLLLESFQMSVAACLAHPQVSMLHCQMSGRLIAARQAGYLKDWSEPADGSTDGASPPASRSRLQANVSCLRTKTPSLEQAGGLQRIILRGHSDCVSKVLLAPGGIDVITGSADGNARIWDMEIGDCMLLLEGHKGPITDMAVAADGSVVVTASKDGTARVYDLDNGQPLHVLEGHNGAVNSIAVDGKGRFAVTAGADGMARVWQLKSGKCVQLLMGHSSHGALGKVVLTANGQKAVTTSEDFTARVWDISSGRCLHVLAGHSAWVVHVDISGHGEACITASHDGTARLWNLRNGKCMHVLEGHAGRVNAVKFAPDGSFAVTVSDDFTSRIWNLQDGTCRSVLNGHGGWVNDCAILPGCDRGVTASGDDLAVVWDLQSGSCLNVLEGHTGEVRSVVVTRRGRFAVTGSQDGTARVWDLQAGSAHLQLTHSSKVHGLAVSLDHCRAISFGDDGAFVWDLEEAKCSEVLEGHDVGVRWVVPLAERGRLLTVSGDRMVKAWSLPGPTCLATLPSHQGSRVKSFAASRDGRVAVVVLFDSTVTLWDLETMQQTAVLQRWGERDAALGHTGGINAAYMTPDGSHVLTVSKDSTARVWDLATHACLHTLEGHTDGITAGVLSEDGASACTLSYDGTARVWDMESGACRGVLPHGAAVTRAAFSADATMVVLASCDKTASLWDLTHAPFSRLATWKEHKDEVTDVAFSRDGSLVATVSRDCTLAVWSSTSGKMEGLFMADAGLTCCAFANSTLIAGDESGVVHLLNLPA